MQTPVWGQDPTLLAFLTQVQWWGYMCPDTSLLVLMVWGRNILWSFWWNSCSYKSPYIDNTGTSPTSNYYLWAPYVFLNPICKTPGIHKWAEPLCKGECTIGVWLILRNTNSLCLSCLSPLDEPYCCWQTESQSKKMRCTRSWKEGIMGLCAKAPKHDL